MVKITIKKAASKVGEPRANAPLFTHVWGYWYKRVTGRLVYFGKVADDPKRRAALDKWRQQKDDLLAGHTPRVAGDGSTSRDLT